VGSSWCPRCGSDLVAPSAYSSAWRCGQHGDVLPLRLYHRLDPADLDHVRSRAEVPLWLPDPLPLGWQLAGLAAVGDDRSRIRATVTAFRGPAPLGGEGEWLIVAEEPGIGLGSGYAGLSHTEPTWPPTAPPPAKIHALGHPTPLWAVSADLVDRSSYVGEAGGVWLWMIGFPADAGYALMENLFVSDGRWGSVPPIPATTPTNRLRPLPPDRAG
jgi:uncharacterized protein DUF6758